MATLFWILFFIIVGASVINYFISSVKKSYKEIKEVINEGKNK